MDWRRWAQEFLSVYSLMTHRSTLSSVGVSPVSTQVANPVGDLTVLDNNGEKEGLPARRSYEKMCGKLEEELRSTVYFEKEEKALLKIKSDHENWLRETRYLLFCCRNEVMSLMDSFVHGREI